MNVYIRSTVYFSHKNSIDMKFRIATKKTIRKRYLWCIHSRILVFDGSPMGVSCAINNLDPV